MTYLGTRQNVQAEVFVLWFDPAFSSKRRPQSITSFFDTKRIKGYHEFRDLMKRFREGFRFVVESQLIYKRGPDQ